MKNTSILSLLFALVFSLPSFAQTWETDYDAAVAKAKAENKTILLNFTGSDWCGWCVRLKGEVFSQAEFIEYAEANLILVSLDFPKRKQLSAEEKAQNQALAQKHGIRGFPTILLLNPEEEILLTTGYKAGGPEEYVKHLKEAIEG